MKRFAFFDVDNTIYNGYTASDLIYFLADREITSQNLVIKYEESVKKYREEIIDYHELAQIALDLFSRAAGGRRRTEIDALTDEYLRNKKNKYFKWVARLFKFLRENDFQIILISAGPDVAIQKISAEIKADSWFATNIEHKDNYYTGAPPALLNDSAKVKVIEKLTNAGEKSISLGFGDSPGDAAMLGAVDHAFVLLNDHHYANIADYVRKYKWNTFENEQQVIKKILEII